MARSELTPEADCWSVVDIPTPYLVEALEFFGDAPRRRVLYDLSAHSTMTPAGARRSRRKRRWSPVTAGGELLAAQHRRDLMAGGIALRCRPAPLNLTGSFAPRANDMIDRD
jgi:hypothetical protein